MSIDTGHYILPNKALERLFQQDHSDHLLLLRLNCWEFFHCGREHEGEYDTCPAARDPSGNRINRGKNAVGFAGLYLTHSAETADIAFMKKSVLHVKSAT